MENLLSKKIYTVSELTYGIKSLLEGKFSYISVKGEISNLREQRSGHSYFSLKDGDAQLSCALFRGSKKNLPKKISDGDQVILTGEISVYPPHGNYQLIIRQVHFLGLGELLLKLHKLKKELQEAGYFNPEHKKKLPFLPRKIGVVTSATGAVIQDIVNVLKRRHPGFMLILNPVKVQGEGAAEEIARAIDDFNQYNLADVLIIGRGGGSLEDLWAFNEKIVADAIYRSRIPVISAVGHETDTSIADFVSDIRAPTPSAAAEIVIAEKEQLSQKLSNSRKQIIKFMVSQIKNLQNQLRATEKQPYLTNPYLLISSSEQKLDEMQTALDSSIKHILKQNKSLLSSYARQVRALSPFNRLALLKQRLTSSQKEAVSSLKQVFEKRKSRFSASFFQEKLFKTMLKILTGKRQRLDGLQNLKTSIDPKNLLKKGYSILFSEKDGSTILSSKSLPKGAKFRALLKDGKILAVSEGEEKGGKYAATN